MTIAEDSYNQALKIHRKKNRIGVLRDMPDRLDASGASYSGYRLIDDCGGFRFNGAYWRSRRLVAFRGAVLFCARFGELHEQLILWYEDGPMNYRVMTLDHFEHATGAELDNDLTRQVKPAMQQFLETAEQALKASVTVDLRKAK